MSSKGAASGGKTDAKHSLRVGVIGAGVMGSNHARVLAGLPDSTLVGVVDPLPAHRTRVTELTGCRTFEPVLVMEGVESTQPIGGRRTLAFEALLACMGHDVPWGAFDENAPAGLCYTSGTTGAPKGVEYTHRSNYLHTLRALQADAFALTAADALLVAVPMFHANGWGLPFAAPAVGAKLVFPGRHTDGARLANLIRNEGVTVAAGVQTVWQGLLDHLDETGGEVPTLTRVII